MRAKGAWSDIVCARSCFATTGNSEFKTFPSPRVPKSPYRLTDRQRPPSVALCSNSPSSSTDCADWTPARFLKVATGPESSGDEFGILEDDRCIDTGVYQQRYLSHELVYHPDSSRLVRRPDSSSVRAGSPLGRQHHGNGDTRDLVRTAVRELPSNKLFLAKQQAISSHSDQMPWKRRRSWLAFLLPQSRLALPERHRPARTHSWSFSLIRGAAAAGTAAQGSAPRRAGPCRPAFQAIRACARVLQSGMRSPHWVPSSRLSQGSTLFTSSCSLFQMSWKRKRSWTADALCRLDTDCVPMGDREHESTPLGSDPQREHSWRRRHTVLTAFSAARTCLRALSV